MRPYVEDLYRAGRTLLKTPLFTIPIVATLAVSVGATAGVFSVVNAVLIRGLPFRDPDRLVWISSVRPERPDAPFSLPELMDFRAQARTIDIAAYASWSAIMATTSVGRRLQGMRISANAFEVLGVSAPVGRLLVPRDDEVSAAHVAVVSHGFWQRELGGTSAAVGQTVRLNGEPYTVVGVLPRYFPLPLRDVDVVVPLVPELDPRRHARNSVNFLRLFGRVAGNASPAAAEREVGAITKTLRDAYPIEYATKLGVRVTSMHEYIVGGHRQTLLVLLGGVALTLVIAFVNVLNLLLIRGTVRQGEIAMRRALGASARQIARHLFAEASLLAMAGGVAGAALAYGGVALIVQSGPADVPRLAETRVDAAVLLLVAALSAVGTVLFGLVPLVAALRTVPQTVLRGSGRGQGESRRQSRVRGAFVVAQIALAVVLTAATGGILTSLVRLQRVDLGFSPDSVFVARLSLPPGKFAGAGDVARFYERLNDALIRQPGVVAVGVTSVAPLSGLLASVPFSVAGRPPASARERPQAHFRAVSPGYFQAIRAPLVAGRAFTERDGERAVPVAIVSRALAERHLAGLDPIGQQILIDDNNTGPRPVTVVGVLEDLRHVELDGPPSFDVYIPLRQVHRDGVSLVTNNQFWTIRLATDAAGLAARFARALKEAEPDAAASGLSSMQDYVSGALAPRRFTVVLLVGFAAIAVLLATFGVYGVVAYSVARRRREIGLRMALGASPRRVLRLVLGRTLGLAAAGIVLGVGGSLLTSQALAGLLFGVAPNEPAILAAVSALLAMAAVVASSLPAWRASRIAPSVALSAE